MKVVLAADHAGFALKETLKSFVQSLGHDVEDCGAHAFDAEDDYPQFIQAAARKVAVDPQNTRGIILGGSGQGEAIAANRFKGVRAAIYYGEPVHPQTDAQGKSLDMISSTREHNDANILSLGARFISEDEAKKVVQEFLAHAFSGADRHVRRIKQIDEA